MPRPVCHQRYAEAETIRRWLGYAALGIVALVLLVLGVGAALPAAHVARVRALVPAPRAEVWRVLTDVGGYPSWRSDLSAVEILDDTPLTWLERGRNGDIRFTLVEAAEPARLVTRIADEALPFAGSWTYELTDAGTHTLLTITEHGSVRNPAFRFLSRFIFGHYATLDGFVRALGRRFGGSIEPEHIP